MAVKESHLEKKSSGPGFLAKGYLLVYNGVQFAGWSYILYKFVEHFASGKDINTLWSSVRLPLMIFQNAAVVEIFNVMFGFVKTNLLTTILQVASRVMVVCGVLNLTPTAPLSLGLPLLLLAWSVTEIIRYLFYALNTLSIVPYSLIWCRYTFFYLLYPIGVSGELLCFYAAQLYVRQHKLLSIELPNPANFTFSYHYVQLAVMSSYLPLFPRMFLHMVSQRKKVIEGARKEE